MIRKLIKEAADVTETLDLKEIDGGWIKIKSVPQQLNFSVHADKWYAFRWMIGPRNCISIISLTSPWMFSTYQDIIDAAETGGGNAVIATNLSTGDTPIDEPKDIQDVLDGLSEWMELGVQGEDPFATWTFVTLTGFDSANNDLFSKV